MNRYLALALVFATGMSIIYTRAFGFYGIPLGFITGLIAGSWARYMADKEK